MSDQKESGKNMTGMADPGRDGKPYSGASDLGEFSTSGEPRKINAAGRANVEDTTPANGESKSASGALAEFGGVSDPQRISALKVSGASIEIPREGYDDAKNLKV
jgi:hypothetical protein